MSSKFDTTNKITSWSSLSSNTNNKNSYNADLSTSGLSYNRGIIVGNTNYGQFQTRNTVTIVPDSFSGKLGIGMSQECSKVSKINSLPQLTTTKYPDYKNLEVKLDGNQDLVPSFDRMNSETVVKWSTIKQQKVRN